MRREGRQHGMVITFISLEHDPSSPIAKPSRSSNSKFLKRMLDSSEPPTAGMFSKVQARPTNHSKYTSRCGRLRCNGCHMYPCHKSEGKTKGRRKQRSQDVVCNSKLAAWTLQRSGAGAGVGGFSSVSATRLLDQLASLDDDVCDLY